MSNINIVLPGETLALKPESPGFAHGYGLFETLRLCKGQLEFWQAHWSRLRESASKLGLACPFDSAAVLDGIKVLAIHLPPEAVIKLSLIREDESPRLQIYSRPSNPVPKSVGLLLDCPYRVNENSVLAGHKTHNYLENLLALEAAHEAGCYDTVRTNLSGILAEGAISNLFFLRGSQWFTPGPASGLLPGVIRGVLLENLPVEQGDFEFSDLLKADAVYLTNSSVGLLPVDWLVREGTKTPLDSCRNHSYKHALGLLNECRSSSAIPL